MGQIVTTYPTLPCATQTLALGGTQYRLRLTWRARLGAWYADLWTLDGTEVWLGQRVSTQWGLGFGLGPENKPDGVFLVRGPAEYTRLDLGATVQLVFYPTDELPDVAGSELGISVVMV